MSQAADVHDDADDWKRPRLAWLWDTLLFVALMGLYTLTATVTLQGHDNAEWVSASILGGTPHPPGYPLYTLLLRLWGLLPHGNPAFHTALLSSLLMALSCVVLVRAIEERSGSTFAAHACALAYGLTLPVWRLAGVAEVVSLLSLNAAALLWSVHRVDNIEEIKPRHGALIGALFGVGVAHHHSLALLLPLLLPHVILSHQGAGARRWTRAIGAGVVVGTAVVVVAFALMLAWPSAPNASHFTELQSFSQIVRHVLRLDYGTFSSSQRAGSWSFLPTVDLLKDTAFGLHILCLLALFALKARRARWLFLCWLLAGPWLLGGFTVQDGAGQVLAPLETRERFHALPLMLVVVMASDAVAAAAWQLPRRRGIRYAQAQAALLLFTVLLGGISRLPDVSWRHEHAVEDTLKAAVQAAPKDAVVVLTGDAWQMGWALTAQQLGRSDVIPLAWPRGFLGSTPSDQGTRLLMQACGTPCPADRWHTALTTISKERPVVFFPATGAARVMQGEPLAAETLFSRIQTDPQPLEAQESALKAYQDGVKISASLDDPRRYWERHAIAVWAAPWLVLMDQAQKAGNQPLQSRAQAEAMAIMARIQPAHPEK